MSQNALIRRLVAGKNVSTRSTTWCAIDSLCKMGYITKTKVGKAGIVSCSVAGRNYVVMLETTLKRLRWGSIG